jgi:Asp-tRNA(Asn)/Glu-tRNA(Gln) amidotransferase A subunit family amidase
MRLTLAEAARQTQAGRLDPSELADDTLAAARAVGPAFIEVTEDRARFEADKRASGGSAGCL